MDWVCRCFGGSGYPGGKLETETQGRLKGEGGSGQVFFDDFTVLYAA